MTVRITLEPCINCGWCRRVCPTETVFYFTTRHRTHIVEPSGCIDCDLCIKVCPENCIAYDPSYVHDEQELEAAKEKARTFASKQRAEDSDLRERAAAAIATIRNN